MNKTVILSLLSMLSASPAQCNNESPTSPSEINDAAQEPVLTEVQPYAKNNIFLNHKEIIDDLYFLSHQHLLWINPQQSENQRINEVFQLISSANASGLNPGHYNLLGLQAKWQQLNEQKTVTVEELLSLDTEISINLLSFLADLHFGRIDPSTLDLSSHQTVFSLLPLIIDAIKNDKISQLSSLVEPISPVYRQLKSALLEYQKRASIQIPIETLKYSKTLHPKDDSQQIVKIRQHLNPQTQSTAENPLSSLYDEDLVNKMKKFQFINGLKEDGIIGKNTFKALNILPSQRVQMIKLALERLRWLPKAQANPLIMVNIPSFKLRAYHPGIENRDKIQTLDMRVIVGKSKKDKFKSPVFTADMRYLEFSPYWNIPKSITIDEILPKLLEDPFYLEDHNMEMVTGFHNNEIAIDYIDDSYGQLQAGNIKLRQRPGKGNSLGKVKFIFPNNYNVYLHDTPSRRLFKKSKRDLSHGCIRVEKPAELAQFLLQTKKGWNEKEISKAMNLPSPKKVWLKESIPVIIYYLTASIEQGDVVFYNDVYNYDSKLTKALMKHSPALTTVKVPTMENSEVSKVEITTLN